ncbi:mu-type opioid receptor-like [Tubulanus polymorphus]|uniref:mu-type opioid receptor-like n=1 Tax=Tubulanus polymorphus TaxID=672921 RepID=UPI003DA52F35
MDGINATASFGVSNNTIVNIVAQILVYGILPLSFVIGTIGNIWALKVLLSPHYTKSSTGIYMIALEIFDISVVSIATPVLFVRIVFEMEALSNEFCQFYYFLLMFTSSSSNLTMAFMSIDRLFVVWSPFRAKAICTPKKARIVLAIMVILLTGYSVGRIVPVRMYDYGTLKDCDYPLGGNARLFVSFFHNVIQFLLPFVIIFTCNVTIATILVLQAGKRKDMTTGTSKSQKNLTIMLISISTVFLVLNLPLFAYRILKYMSNVDRIVLNLTYWVARGFTGLNSAVNFYLYCMTSQRFRAQLCKRGHRDSQDTHTINSIYQTADSPTGGAKPIDSPTGSAKPN